MPHIKTLSTISWRSWVSLRPKSRIYARRANGGLDTNLINDIRPIMIGRVKRWCREAKKQTDNHVHGVCSTA